MTYERVGAVFIAGLWAFVALPIFIDLASFSLLLEKSFIIERGKIPFPLGGAAFAVAVFLSYGMSFVARNEFNALLSPQQMVCFVVFALLPFFIYTVLVSGLSLARVAQLLLPLLALCVLSVPAHASTQKLLVLSVMAGSGAFYMLHVVSIIKHSGKLFSADYFEFSFFFEYLIYQSLVTYPGVLSLYFFCGLAVLLSPRFGVLVRSLAGLYISVIFSLLLIASRRASMLEIGGGIGIIFAGVVLASLWKGRFFVSRIMLMMIAFVLSPLLLYFVKNSPLYQRASNSYSAGRFDSGRLDIYSSAIAHFMDNPGLLIFGAGGSGAVGYHNFFLDTVYRIGLLGLCIYISMLAYLIVKFYRLSKAFGSGGTLQNVMVVVVLYLLFIQTFVNTSITQPYYALNLLSALLLVRFCIFGKKSSTSVSSRLAGL